LKLVRKELIPEGSDFQKELDNLTSLNLLRHPNILRLLGSYTYRKRHNLIFPRARGGTLAKLFTAERPRHFKEDEVLLVAFAKLASAVGDVHDFVVRELTLARIGCHHDLKPDNILVDGNDFILADFGLTRFKESNEDSATQFKIGRGYCLAPECQDLDDSFERHAIHRSSDIWAFGCIMADFTTYMVLGPDGVKEFRKQRKFQIANHIYYYYHHGTEPSPAVTEWIASLEISCTKPFKMLLDLTRRMLEMKPSLRPSAKEVAAELRFIALLALFLKVSGQWQSLQNIEEEGTINPRVERLRFASWGWLLGMASDETDRRTFNSSLVQDFTSFQTAVGFLQDMSRELDSMASRDSHAIARILLPMQHLNSSLIGLLPQQVQRRAMEYVELRLTETENIEELSTLQHTCEGVLIRQLAIIKRLTLLVKNELSLTERGLELQKRPMIGHGQVGHHFIGMMEVPEAGQIIPVLIEYKSYTDPLLRQRLFTRMEGIARVSNSLLHPEQMRVLHCRGYYHDDDRLAFGLVFDFPEWAQTIKPPFKDVIFSLQSILESQLREQMPSLGQRFRLAYNLASAVYNFEKAGWFHKGISSSNIVFFSKTHKILNTSSLEPYIIGFRHSRPHDVVTFTEGPASADQANLDGRYYQHPEYLQENVAYSFEHEYYSLGVVLLEVGLWKPVSKLAKGLIDMASVKRRERLLENVVPRLAQTMGLVYQKLVFELLSMDCHGKTTHDVKDAPAWFEAAVLTELYRLSSIDI